MCPGYVDTDMAAFAVDRVTEQTGRSREQALADILRTVGQKRLVTPDEVAHLVAGLADPQAGSTTAQAIVMDAGGLCA